MFKYVISFLIVYLKNLKQNTILIYTERSEFLILFGEIIPDLKECLFYRKKKKKRR